MAALSACGDTSEPSADAGPALPICSDGIVSSITNAQAPAADSEAYEPLNATELTALRASFGHVFSASNGAAVEAATSADYVLCKGSGAESVLVRWAPRATDKGRATIAFRGEQARALIVGAPHPEFETNTLDEAKMLFEQTHARALIVGGTHRCATASLSGCSGTTGVCGISGESYRVSDMAHVTASAFHAAHQQLIAEFADDWLVSLHGMSGAGASLSNGTTNAVTADSPVANLAAALQAEFPSEPITTCNSYPGANTDQRLCGTTNVQGRLINSVADACTIAAPTASERFIHIEQSLAVRSGRQKVVDAFDAVVN